MSRVGPTATLALIAAGTAAVLALWWHSTRAIVGPGGALTTLGEGLGLLAGYGVVVAVLLMARLPPVERGVGADRLARWHATLGRVLCWVISGHVLFIIWGYALAAHANVVSETATLLTTYPDVLMATVGYFLLLGVGLTSLRALRRRLRYETWYYLHLYSYLAIALAFSHQFANGAAFVDNAAARFAWEAAVRRHRRADRLVPADRPGPRLRAATASSWPGVREEAEPHRLRLHQGTGPGRARRRARAVLPLAVPHPRAVVAVAPVLALGAAERRPDAHHGPRRRRPEQHAALAPARHPGARRGAVRRVLPAPARAGRPALLLAGGVGITPLRAMMAALTGSVTLVYRASSWQDVALRSELDTLAAERGGRGALRHRQPGRSSAATR